MTGRMSAPADAGTAKRLRQKMGEDMIKGVAFDMDGLMFDTERLAVDAWLHAGKQMGLAITRELPLRTVGLDYESTRRAFFERLGISFNFEAAKGIRADYIAAQIEKNGIQVKAGLFALLAYLKSGGYKTAVATSTDRARALYYLEKAGVSRYFRHIICGDMLARGKPEPDIYLKAAALMRLAPQVCIALEDSPMGILSAFRAGMKPVMIPDLVQPDGQTESLLHAKLNTLHDCIPLLEKQKQAN